jgi:hypothetical protein
MAKIFGPKSISTDTDYFAKRVLHHGLPHPQGISGSQINKWYEKIDQEIF